MIKSVFLSMLCLFFCTLACAEMAIETAVSKSTVAVGDQVELDVIITDAIGNITRPSLGTLNGFSSYSQGSTQEISFVNGQKSSRSIFSFVLIANEPGKKAIGPIEIQIGGKIFKAPAVDINVVSEANQVLAPQTQAQGPYTWATPPGSSQSQQNPGPISNDDIFVRASLDKDEAFINEPVILTYTVYTRLSATYKGFEKEPVTTGFWVEDFPPEKVPSKTEQMINGSRYVTADVRRVALFPTQAGEITMDTGVVAANVELRDEGFDQFFSNNIFGRRNQFFVTPGFPTQIVARNISANAVRLNVKPLPESGRPSGFAGAVGDYKIESSVDKTEVEEGTPLTYRLRISGQGNINTLQVPSFPKLNDFKIYDSSSSVNVDKSRMRVEGEKVVETVLVPKKSGSYQIPALAFSFFDPRTQSYREISTTPHLVKVNPGPEQAGEARSGPSGAPVEAASKEDVAFVGNDIRFIKTEDLKPLIPQGDFYKKPAYWTLNGVLFLLSVGLLILTARRRNAIDDLKGLRFRNVGFAAKSKLKAAQGFLKKNEHDAFYSEISKAVAGYFSDKLNIPITRVSPDSIRAELEGSKHADELGGLAQQFFKELHYGQFAHSDKDREEMQKVYQMAVQTIDRFEKVKR